MKTLYSILILVLFCAIPAMSADLALGADIANLFGAKGGPSVQRIPLSIEAVPIGRFSQPMRVFPVVEIVDGDEKDRVRAKAALLAELQGIAFRCNFTVSTGIKAPAGSLTFTLTVVKDRGQSTDTYNRSDSQSWGSGGRGYRSGSSSSASSSSSGQNDFVGTSASGGLDLNEADGSTTGIAFVDNVFSAAEQRTASDHQDSSSSSSGSHSRRWGGSGVSQSSTSGSSYRTDPEYSKSQSSRVTIAEAVETAVRCVMARGIDFYNATHRKAGDISKSGDISPQREVSPETPGTTYAVSEDGKTVIYAVAE